MSEKSAKGAKGNARRKGRGEFFAVDRRSWGAVCGLSAEDNTSTTNMAAAYLVLASFSDGTNLVTTASAHAVERYTGISRGRASDAIKGLVAGGAVEALHVEDSAKAGPSVPRYRLRPWSEFRGHLALRYRASLNEFTKQPAVCLNPCPVGHVHPDVHFRKRCEERQKAAVCLVAAGLAVASRVSEEDTDGKRFDRPELWTLEVVPAGDGSLEPVWLPNALVCGAGKETPPVERARRTANVDNLRTLVELYAEQDLLEDGGVSRETWRWPSKRVGPYIIHGAYAVYGFDYADDRYYSPRARLFRALDHSRAWNALRWVERAGLTTRVVYVVESDDVGAQPLYPLATYDVSPTGQVLSSTFNDANARAVRAEMSEALRRIDPDYLATAHLRDAAVKNDMDLWHVVLVDRSFSAVSLVGILRLKYRPRTKNTSRWFAREGRSLGRALEDLQRIGRTPAELEALHAEANDNGAEEPQENTYGKAVS